MVAGTRKSSAVLELSESREILPTLPTFVVRHAEMMTTKICSLVYNSSPFRNVLPVLICPLSILKALTVRMFCDLTRAQLPCALFQTGIAIHTHTFVHPVDTVARLTFGKRIHSSQIAILRLDNREACTAAALQAFSIDWPSDFLAAAYINDNGHQP